jgi:hypothetical protein
MAHSVFEHLTSLNRNVDAAIEILLKLAEYQELQDEDFIVGQAFFREYLASVNVSIQDAMGETEQKAIASAYKERRAYEKKPAIRMIVISMSCAGKRSGGNRGFPR